LLFLPHSGFVQQANQPDPQKTRGPVIVTLGVTNNKMNSIKLIEKCHQKYLWDGRCEDCQNYDCQGDCNSCLDNIHMNRIKRRYNCKNITYFYVCKYLLKYMSEFYHLVENSKALRNLDRYDIFSIGCGPCSDLFGIAKHLIKNRKATPIKYIGVDLNENWSDIHELIKKRTEKSKLNIDIRFHNKDITRVLKNTKGKKGTIPVNIITLHYVLSDMVANNLNITEFLEKLYKHIIKRLPSGSFVIINDINHYNTRDYFDIFLKLLQSKGKYKFKRYHYNNNNRTAYEYGEQHPLNSLAVSIPDYLYDYNVWEFCSSSQMLIKKM
jgi:hypothetical protein